MECRETIPLFKVYMNDEVGPLVNSVLYSGWIGQGPKVVEFEKRLSLEFENSRVLALSAGTHGLSLALRLAGVGPGDEVITTPLTCTATNMPILMHGADIVWADIKPTDLNIDPKSVESSITERTKAIMVVHWGGYPCDMKELSAIADDNDLRLIEDGAHTFGSVYGDSVIGDCRYADYSIMSFQAIKHLTTVDGGALFVKYEKDYERGKLLRWYGIDRESPRKDMRCEEDIYEYGYKYHMNDVSATIGLANFEQALNNVGIARSNAMYYNKELTGTPGVEVIQVGQDRLSSYWIYTLLVEDRTSFAHMMGTKGISVSRVHERNDKHTFVKEYKKNLPGLESVIDKMICIPVGWWITKEDREYIVEVIKSGW
jgi:dTDP-4-amino-4,6-dideoxygalactose transaminase